HLGVPGGFDDWHWAASLNQARAVGLAIEHFRALSPLCAGAVVWQLNDMWPVTSWSAVDGDGRRKPLWYTLRRVFADRLLTFQPRAGGLALAVVNDSDTPWAGTAEVVRRGFDGHESARVSLGFEVAPRSAEVRPLPAAVAVAGDAARELLTAGAEDGDGPAAETAYWFFAEDVDSALPPQELDVTAEAVADGYRLTVKSSTLVRDLAVLADRIAPDAVVDRMLVTLLPGQGADFHVRTAARVAPEAFADPLVLRSANQLRYP
ncbi:MAG: glycoside hydrolase family 2 protein, partial [Catenulispora sp.]